MNPCTACTGAQHQPRESFFSFRLLKNPEWLQSVPVPGTMLVSQLRTRLTREKWGFSSDQKASHLAKNVFEFENFIILSPTSRDGSPSVHQGTHKPFPEVGSPWRHSIHHPVRAFGRQPIQNRNYKPVFVYPCSLVWSNHANEWWSQGSSEMVMSFSKKTIAMHVKLTNNGSRNETNALLNKFVWWKFNWDAVCLVDLHCRLSWRFCWSTSNAVVVFVWFKVETVVFDIFNSWWP